MCAKKDEESKIPLILRYHRLMEAFAKSNDERDFYLEVNQGYIVYLDLEKPEGVVNEAEVHLRDNLDSFLLLPKLTFYESKKIMEGFVNEKVYDIDTKDKLLEIIQTKDARENFLEFIYDNLTEVEKWQQFFQERSRIRIIEWLRTNKLDFVFEEDLAVDKDVLEKIKLDGEKVRATKDVQTAKSNLRTKAKTYWSNEALNPRPKRGRPPKQVVKVEVTPEFVSDHYQGVPKEIRPFLFCPDYTSPNSISFSSKFDNEEEFLSNLRSGPRSGANEKLEALAARLESLKKLSSRIGSIEGGANPTSGLSTSPSRSSLRSETPATERRSTPTPKKKVEMEEPTSSQPEVSMEAEEKPAAKPKERLRRAKPVGRASSTAKEKAAPKKRLTPLKKDKTTKVKRIKRISDSSEG